MDLRDVPDDVGRLNADSGKIENFASTGLDAQMESNLIIEPPKPAIYEFNDQHKIMAAMCCIAAAGRLQGLEMRRYGTDGNEWKPFSPEEWKEYHYLKQWWENFGYDNQLRLAALMHELSLDVQEVSRAF